MPTKKAAEKAQAKTAPPKGTDLVLGDPAPDFEALDQAGKRHRLEDYKGKTVVLYFYPKDDTPGCTQEACDFKSHFARFGKKGAVILGVSSDSAESHKSFKEKHGLPFPLLVDEKHVLSKAYGAWTEKSGVQRSTFVLGEGGKISRIFRNVNVTGHVKALLEGA